MFMLVENNHFKMVRCVMKESTSRTVLRGLIFTIIIGVVVTFFIATFQSLDKSFIHHMVLHPDYLSVGHRGRHTEVSLENETSTSAKSTSIDRAEVERLQVLRKQHLKNVCAALNLTQPKSHLFENLERYRHVFVLPKLKLIYCAIPKVGSTMWKRLFLSLHGFPKYLETRQNQPHMFADHYFMKLSKLSPKAAKSALEEYTSFFFVRNPYSRILSAYRDKFLVDNGFTRPIQQRVRDWLRHERPNSSFPRNQTKIIGFEEFVDHYTNARTKDVHWEDMNEICNPCEVDYDFIGYYETLDADADYLLANVQSGIRFPDAMRSPTHSSKQDILTKYYSKLTEYQFKEFSNRVGLRRDMQVFDYDIPDPIKKLIFQSPIPQNRDP